MKVGKDISVKLGGLHIVHQNLPKKFTENVLLKENVLFIPISGSFKIIENENTFFASPGKMIYIPSNTPHTFISNDSQGERLIVLIDKKILANKNLQSKSLVSSQLCQEIVFYLLTKKDSPLSTSLCQLYGKLLVEHIENSVSLIESEFETGMAKVNDSRVKKALEYIETHFSEVLDMNALAKQSGLSIRNLNRLFVKETGSTPKQILISFRMEEAKKLLIKKRNTITEVSFMVGYNSLSLFIKTFRQHTGKIPSQYFG